MHDLSAIRQSPEAFDAGLAKRGLSPLSPQILAQDAARREAMNSLQALQSERNRLAKAVGMAKGKGENAESLLAEAKQINDQMAGLEAESARLQQELDAFLSTLPNLPAEDVPLGKDEQDNQEIRRHGTPPAFAFPAQLHDAIGEGLKLMDFERAAKLSGARFVYLMGGLARLERALGQFMLDLHTREFGYTEVVPPVLVNDAAMFGTGQLPKFAEDLFRTTDGRWLIPTAEVSLTNLVADSIVPIEELPLRLTALTNCFRAEAGSAGRDTRGMIRQHQFSKVELVSITRAEESEAEHERMTDAAETVLKRLGLPFRTMLLCTGDMGFSARKTYDIEVWMPGQDCYREISSCSNCGDFQARRMKARTKVAGDKNTQTLHTLNGSGLAVGRTLVAVLENYQQADGSVVIPEVLRPYMGGLEVLRVE
jgi:seryl-tRNA synthetase